MGISPICQPVVTYLHQDTELRARQWHLRPSDRRCQSTVVFNYVFLFTLHCSPAPRIVPIWPYTSRGKPLERRRCNSVSSGSPIVWRTVSTGEDSDSLYNARWTMAGELQPVHYDSVRLSPLRSPRLYLTLGSTRQYLQRHWSSTGMN